MRREWRTTDGDQAPETEAAPLQVCAVIKGTEIATAMGWKRVESLSPGDKVLTFDRGLCPLLDVVRHDPILLEEDQPTPASMRPIHVPEGIVGNEMDFDVLPGAYVMIESEVAEALLGDPFLLLPAAALTSRAGVEQATAFTAAPALVSLVFEQDEVIFLRRGGMQLCPARGAGLELIGTEGHAGPMAALDLAEARDFLAMTMADTVTVGPGPSEEKRKAAGWRAA